MASIMDEYRVEIVKSARRTVSLRIREDGSLLLRAPNRMTKKEMLAFLEEKRGWIVSHAEKLEQQRREREAQPKLTQAEIRALADRAKTVIPERVAHYAPLVGVSFGRITIRNQRSRWGSCSSTGNLNFNCLLLLTPPEVLDSVVVHELCHRKEMNHSSRFYAEVLRVYPEYRRWNAWLKEHGGAILARME